MKDRTPNRRTHPFLYDDKAFFALPAASFKGFEIMPLYSRDQPTGFMLRHEFWIPVQRDGKWVRVQQP